MRPDDPDPVLVHALVDHLFRPTRPLPVARVAEGVSTFVYRIRRGSDTFYLRILPEADASFAPEVRVLALLRERGVRVPEVIAFEHRDAWLNRSILVTTAVPGYPIGRRPVDTATRQVLVEAGQQLALINGVPVAGFGWVRRDRAEVSSLEGEHPTYRAFVEEHLDDDVALLGRSVLTRQEIARVRAVINGHPAWLEGEQAWLAHGDFDVTAIFQRAGRYTGIIDFGEIRGGDRWYDLGHFRMHDGETLPALVLDWLVEGYGSVQPLAPDFRERISFTSLLIAIRAVARQLAKGRSGVQRHQGVVAIRRDLAILQP